MIGAGDRRGWIGLAVVLVVWEVLAWSLQGSALWLRPIEDVVAASRELIASGDLWLNYSTSLARVISGYCIGAVAGFALGALLGMSRTARWIIGPLFNAIRQVPMFGWVPLIGLWFGLGDSGKTTLIVLSTLYPVTLATFEGFRNVPAGYREVAALLCFSRWTLLRRVLAPAAVPSISTGLRQGLAFAWISVVGAEMFMAAAPGLGSMLVAARAQFRSDVILLGMVLIGATGFAINAAMLRMEKRALRWTK